MMVWWEKVSKKDSQSAPNSNTKSLETYQSLDPKVLKWILLSNQYPRNAFKSFSSKVENSRPTKMINTVWRSIKMINIYLNFSIEYSFKTDYTLIFSKFGAKTSRKWLFPFGWVSLSAHLLALFYDFYSITQIFETIN